MIDKTKRKATASRNGAIVEIHMTGGPDCLWMNMYLDTAEWQMTCDSDIGFYAYHWGRNVSKNESFLKFCCRWLSDGEWLLRKCIGEKHVSLDFNVEKSETALREAFAAENGESEDNDFNDVLEEAYGYSDTHKEYCVALNSIAAERGVCLPDEWYEHIVCEYSTWQKRFAEICREVIVPELEKLLKEDGGREG